MTIRGIGVAALLWPLAAAAAPRIVSTGPAITEILFALELGPNVAAVSNYCHYPEAVRRLPKIGTYLEPNLESIAVLQPDLVIVERLPNNAVDQLRRLRLHVLEVEFGTLDKIYASMRAIARAGGVPIRGDQLVSRIRARLEAVRVRAAKLPPRSMIFLVGRNPGRLEGLIAVGKGSYLNELIALAGGRNPLAQGPLAYAKVSLESLVAVNPDLILDMGDMSQTAGTPAHRQAVLRLWQPMKMLAAVRTGNVHAIDSDIFVVPGPRIADAAEEFARLLHPEPTR
ncbi:MAG: helical backbone metal receptor [Bryobacteraceae bacterium]